MLKSKWMIALATATAIVACANTAEASSWARHHPRQAEVLHREKHQIHRINVDRRHGDITRQQAHAMKAGDRAIARQDHADARANGGHITRSQKAKLNAEENAQSRAIGH